MRTIITLTLLLAACTPVKRETVSQPTAPTVEPAPTTQPGTVARYPNTERRLSLPTPNSPRLGGLR